MALASFAESVLEAVPGKQGHLEHHKEQRQGEEIPVPDVVNKKAVLKDANCQHRAKDAGLA